MKKTTKILIAILIILAIVVETIILINIFKNKNSIGKLYKKGEVKIGDKIDYISFNDSEIKWQVLGEDEEGNIKIIADKSSAVDFGWERKEESVDINDFYDLEKAETFYLTFIEKANEIAKKYEDGKGALKNSAHALTLEEIAKVCNQELKDNNKQEEITGTYPGEGNTTKTVTDNLNQFLINKGALGQTIYEMLFNRTYYNLATQGTNIAGGVAYFNMYVVMGDGVQGMEKYSTNNGEISQSAKLYINYFEYARDFRTVVTLKKDAQIEKTNENEWKIK